MAGTGPRPPGRPARPDDPGARLAGQPGDQTRRFTRVAEMMLLDVDQRGVQQHRGIVPAATFVGIPRPADRMLPVEPAREGLAVAGARPQLVARPGAHERSA